MARTDHHTRTARLSRPLRRDCGARHSLGVSLGQRAEGPHHYRDENAPGEKVALRRQVRRTGRHAFRAEVAEYLR